MPGAHEVDDLFDVPMVVVADGRVLVDGLSVGSARANADLETPWHLPELAALLRAKQEIWGQLHPHRPYPDRCLLHLYEDTPAIVVKSVFSTVVSAGCHRPAFVVRRLASPVNARAQP